MYGDVWFKWIAGIVAVMAVVGGVFYLASFNPLALLEKSGPAKTEVVKKQAQQPKAEDKAGGAVAEKQTAAPDKAAAKKNKFDHLVGQRAFSTRYYPLGTVESATSDGITVISKGPLIWGTRAVKNAEVVEEVYFGYTIAKLTITRGEFRGRPDLAEKKADKK